MQTALDRLIERLEVDPELATGPGSNAARNNFRALLKNLNGTDTLLEVISDIVELKVSPKHVNGEIKSLQELLSPHGYTVEPRRGKVVVQPIGHAATSTTPVKKMSSWIEQHAPDDTNRYLAKAATRPGKGEWQEMLIDSRNALESLASGRFDEAIQELVKEGVIEQGDSARKKDAELLRAIYGFSSTFGAHPGGSADMQKVRADFGYFATCNAIVFLIHVIEEARNSGRKLAKWKSFP